jgi:DNA processing protein
VFAFPGSLGDEYSEGCNFLIRNNKAALLTCVADLAYSMGWEKNSDIKGSARTVNAANRSIGRRGTIFDMIQQHKVHLLPIDDLIYQSKYAYEPAGHDLAGYGTAGLYPVVTG